MEVHEAQLDDQPVVWRSAPGAPVLYVHGVPTSSRMWEPFLARTGGVAVDLPGFGQSGKRGDLDFTLEGYVRFLDRFAELAELGDGLRLCGHDWGGGIALAWALRRPELVDRIAIIDSVPLLPGYRWHRVARAWRTRGLGEVVVGLTTNVALRRALPGPLVEVVSDHFDQGTQRAILRLYRSADPEVLAAAGARLGDLRVPALVAWGDADPYVPSRFADAYAAALGGEVDVVHVEGAGHWPWLDRPELVGTVADLLTR